MEKGTKILIVDDDTFLTGMYSLKFKQAGFEVNSALSGEEAMQKIKDGFMPDLILLDVIMPGMDGIEILEKLKSDHIADKAVIVILSNEADDARIQKAKALGVGGYIVKATTIPSEVVTAAIDIYSHNKKQ